MDIDISGGHCSYEYVKIKKGKLSLLPFLKYVTSKK